MVKIHGSGINTPHNPDHLIDFRSAENVYIFMLFKTPFLAKTINGTEKGEAGDILVNGEGFPHWHKGVGNNTFTNDWINIKGDVLKDLYTEYTFPLNQIFKPIHNTFVTNLIQKIQYEISVKDLYWEENVYNCIRELFLMCSRTFKNSNLLHKKVTNIEAGHYETLHRIRIMMHENFAKDWPIEELAKMAHLSHSRFSSLYKKFFHISAHEDLLNIRITQAKSLLYIENHTIAEVALNCGFSDINYFSRYFKKITGYAPSKFKNQ
jgi:AraC-like DNA-binding protein